MFAICLLLNLFNVCPTSVDSCIQIFILPACLCVCFIMWIDQAWPVLLLCPMPFLLQAERKRKASFRPNLPDLLQGSVGTVPPRNLPLCWNDTGLLVTTKNPPTLLQQSQKYSLPNRPKVKNILLTLTANNRAAFLTDYER